MTWTCDQVLETINRQGLARDPKVCACPDCRLAEPASDIAERYSWRPSVFAYFED